MKNKMSRIFSLKPKVAFRLTLAALIALLGFTSCSKTLFGKREKPDERTDETPTEEIPDLRVDPRFPPDGRAIRVLYGVPPRTYQWGR